MPPSVRPCTAGPHTRRREPFRPPQPWSSCFFPLPLWLSQSAAGTCPCPRRTSTTAYPPKQTEAPLAGSPHAHRVDRSAVRAGCERESIAQGSLRKVRKREGSGGHRSSHGDVSYRIPRSCVKLGRVGRAQDLLRTDSILLKRLVISLHRGGGRALPCAPLPDLLLPLRRPFGLDRAPA